MASSCPFLANIEAQERLTEARYDDGISETFSGGADLVDVSMVVFDQDGDAPNSAGLSTLFTTFGQFLDHDLVLTPEDHDEGVLDLVGMPHDIARSAVADEIGEGETIAPFNAVTWQIDGSQIYGSTEARMDDLRSFEDGKLRVQDDRTSASEMLPDADEDSFMAGDIEGDDPVYLAGDVRANENPNLLSMQTMFVREHNYWAERLAEEHPDWDDAQLYDAARSIVEFELQQITYNEWLPHLVGDAVGEDTGFDANVSGEMSVEFSTAAFRFGHTLVSSSIDRIAEDGTDDGSMALMDSYFNHSPVEDGGIEAIIRGQLSETAQELDTEIVDDLNFFLETPDGVSGFSLAAINLARGLDHGLDSYINVRAQLIGDIAPDTLDPLDFSIITSDEDVQARLATVYTDIFQVDLWVGGLAEDATGGTQMGPLFTHIIADQFTRTRAADETFGDLDPALGDTIIAEVEASTFATIIERTTDVDMVQDDVFIAEDRILTDADPIETTWNADIITLAAKTVNGSIYTQGGDDVVTLSGGTMITGDVSLGDGDDTFFMSSGTVLGSVSTGTGNDVVTLEGTAKVLDGINTNEGEDTVVLSDMAQVVGDVRTGDDNDSVTLSDRASIDGTLCTGGGDDVVTLGARTSVDNVSLVYGDDVIHLEAGADVGTIHGGKGFDTLKLSGNTRVEYDGNPSNGTVFYLDADGNDTGESVAFHSIESITCFTSGTMVISERGKVAIETLQVGDRVWTLDNGLQPIAWIGQATVPAKGDLAPILIRQGAMGNARDLLVSPQHRMMLDGWRVEMHCGADEVLAPAKALINDGSIRRVEGGTVTYVHIAFDTHEIVMAEGIPSESFFPGAEALNALDQAARDEILALFPEWRCPHLRPTAARQVITPREAKALI
ncbi:peroxidase [Octadecabacter temperatus]|uniref:Heme peroxidase n=1 Tax=Octadecabacter temperatus TaxID=1458307 RepID=A0A0K0Y4Z4_9RHOB|nr:peroxidase family protein [Octadecabacter temperatus]AKS45912.1 heme peroxidase [Octadecabacter temperatus]SIO03353.1 peroxidase [Octadecabacter temperatus]